MEIHLILFQSLKSKFSRWHDFFFKGTELCFKQLFLNSFIHFTRYYYKSLCHKNVTLISSLKRTCSGLNLGSMTHVAPTARGVMSTLTIPCTWCRGSTCSTVSCTFHCHASIMPDICACRLPWVCTTPYMKGGLYIRAPSFITIRMVYARIWIMHK